VRKFFDRPYGIYVLALWSIVLGLQNFIRLMYTFGINASGFGTMSLSRFYVYQWFSVILGVSFLVTAFGLWRRLNWGRIAFLIEVSLFFSIALFGVFSPNGNELTPIEKSGLTIQYSLSIILPWVYLNLAFVKDKFQFQRINDE